MWLLLTGWFTKGIALVKAHPKVFLYIAAGGLLFVLWQRDRARQVEKGIEIGDKRTQERMEEAYKTKWAASYKLLEEEKQKYAKGVADNDNYRKVLVAKGAELDHARQANDALLDKTLALVKVSRDAGYQAGLALTAANASDAIRRLSAELEADKQKREREGAGNTPPPK